MSGGHGSEEMIVTIRSLVFGHVEPGTNLRTSLQGHHKKCGATDSALANEPFPLFLQRV